jgi:hypothetical protein
MWIAGFQRRKEVRTMNKPSDKKKGPNTSHWTLVKYLKVVFLPERSNLMNSTANSKRHMVRAFERFAGNGIKLRDITLELLDEFEQWCMDDIRRCLPCTAAERRRTIAAILRHWRPEMFTPAIDFWARDTALGYDRTLTIIIESIRAVEYSSVFLAVGVRPWPSAEKRELQ